MKISEIRSLKIEKKFTLFFSFKNKKTSLIHVDRLTQLKLFITLHKVHKILRYLIFKFSDYSINFTTYFRCGSGGGPGAQAPLDPRFWGPKIEHFWALFNFSIIFFASLRSAYYFFNILLFQSSNSKIFQPHFARHMISHLKVFILSLIFTHFRLLGVHLSLSCF